MEVEESLDDMLSVEEKLINERGDGPAQIVIEKNLRAQAQRRADATKEELEKINSRIDKVGLLPLLNKKKKCWNLIKPIYFKQSFWCTYRWM